MQITGDITGGNTATVRKAFRIGHSYGITLPAKWVAAHLFTDRPYVLATIRPDGDIVLHALVPEPRGPAGRTPSAKPH